MTAPSREEVERMIQAAPFADQEAGIPEMVAALRALLAQRERDAEVKVKPLAWFHGQADGVFAVEVWSAETYTIEERAHTEVFDLFCALWDGEQAQRYDTLEAAKAAAQADYERRILSALVARDAGGE